jgi:prevent-host-death family protein
MTRSAHIQALGTRHVSSVEAKASFSSLVAAVAHANERIVIERHGRPVAMLVGIDEAASLPDPGAPRRRGALALAGAWSEVGDETLDAIVADIYRTRDRDEPRPVDLAS